MKDPKELMEKIKASGFLYAVLSKPVNDQTSKVTVRPIKTKAGEVYQISEQRAEKIYHRNVSLNEVTDILMDAISNHFKQALICTIEADYQLLRNSKNTIAILKKAPSKTKQLLLHNRKKNYLLEEGIAHAYLVELDVMSSDGKVYPKMQDKFRQINRFLEIVNDVVKDLPKNEPIHIVDFGCGKSYLTFALYDYLHHKLQLPIHVIGLDLKRDVIERCTTLTKKLGYQELEFRVGDINHFKPSDKVDMVICLHACDTATDAALENAVNWEARVILAVPCCQHELYSQIAQPSLNSLLRHGILKERFAALVTDAARADLLEAQGYRCQIMEFIDLEHTPKNLLIRAVKAQDDKGRQAAADRFAVLASHLQIDHSLARRLMPKSK